LAKDSIPREQLQEFNYRLVVPRTFSPYASAVLLEPEYVCKSASERHFILRAADGLRRKVGYDRGECASSTTPPGTLVSPPLIDAGRPLQKS